MLVQGGRGGYTAGPITVEEDGEGLNRGRWRYFKICVPFSAVNQSNNIVQLHSTRAPLYDYMFSVLISMPNAWSRLIAANCLDRPS